MNQDPLHGLYRRIGTWRAAIGNVSADGREVNGLQVHALVRHREAREWVLAQSFRTLEYEHRIFHDNGGKHTRGIGAVK